MKVKKKMRIMLTVAACLLILITIVIIQFNTNFNNEGIPYIPIETSKVVYVSLYGGLNGSTYRNATADEQIQIVKWLNAVKRYDFKRLAMHSPGGEPDSNSNIQVNFKDGSSIYIIASDNDYILIGRPFSEVGVEYYVKQPDLYKLLSHLK